MAELLTEGDLDRGHPPNLDRLQAIAALAPHLPPTDWLWEQVVQWATRHLDQDAPALFIEQRHQATQLRDRGQLPDSHTLTSWALTHARHEVNQRAARQSPPPGDDRPTSPPASCFPPHH